jgi:hypothetical protein
MIFNRFFAPAYTSAKPEKRIQAIENLSPDKAQEKTILHELAFNDEDANVSLAALNKLNSFVLWSKMSQIAKDGRVKKAAEKQVNDALLGNSSLALSEHDKAVFLKESASAELITQIVQRDSALVANDELAKALIAKVAKPSFTQFVLFNGASTNLQNQLVAESTDVSILQKWLKKAQDKALVNKIEERISAIAEAAQKPVEFKKQLTLCLSKYQALCDKSDVEVVMQQKAALDSELTGLAGHYELLSMAEQEEYREKQSRIVEQVERYIDRIKPEWEAKQQSEQLAQTRALYEQQLGHAKNQVNWLYNERLCEATLADVATVNESVRAVEATIEQLARIDSNAQLSEKSKAALVELNDKLERFSMQQQYGQKLLVKLGTVETLGLKLIEMSEAQNNTDAPETVENIGRAEIANTEIDSAEIDVAENTEAVKQTFDEAVKEYRLASAELIRVPQPLTERFDNVLSKVKAQEKAKKNAINDALKQVRKQISVVDNLISQGKFRAALSKFVKLDGSVKTLSEDAFGQIEKRFKKTAEDVSRLEGWQDYLAAPRKPALLEEAKALADTPADNIKARSNAIKYLRKQWLTLTSVVQTDEQRSAEDAALQRDFDEALERAFEPCRKHYAELDAAREASLKARESIISSVADLSEDMPIDELAKAFDKLSKQWHSAGQVEQSVYEGLKQQWKQSSAPILKRVNDWQSQNQVQKRKLVEQVKTLVDAEDINAAADEAQEAQRAWKVIGHAGKREESKLWAEFKKANDAIFENLKAQRKSQHNEANSQLDALIQCLSSLEINADYDVFNAAISDVIEQSESLPKPQRLKVQRRIDDIKTKRKAFEREKRNQAVVAKAEALVGLLQAGESASEDDINAMTNTLGKRWATLIEGASSADTTHNRAWLTVALEVACDVPSPESESSTRTSVQLQMMTAKLENGESASASELLSQWLSHGNISAEEEHLKQRIINVIQTNPEVVS